MSQVIVTLRGVCEGHDKSVRESVRESLRTVVRPAGETSDSRNDFRKVTQIFERAIHRAGWRARSKSEQCDVLNGHLPSAKCGMAKLFGGQRLFNRFNHLRRFRFNARLDALQ